MRRTNETIVKVHEKFDNWDVLLSGTTADKRTTTTLQTLMTQCDETGTTRDEVSDYALTRVGPIDGVMHLGSEMAKAG